MDVCFETVTKLIHTSGHTKASQYFRLIYTTKHLGNIACLGPGVIGFLGTSFDQNCLQVPMAGKSCLCFLQEGDTVPGNLLTGIMEQLVGAT